MNNLIVQFDYSESKPSTDGPVSQCDYKERKKSFPPNTSLETIFEWVHTWCSEKRSIVIYVEDD
jgi:hypothetical protein